MRSSEAARDTDGKALVFLHVPKTAGSTLKSIIQRQYPPERTVVIEPLDMLKKYTAFQTQPDEARRRLACVIGHVPYGIDRWLPQGARYITMLRDPVEWTISFHSFIRRMPFFDQDPDFAVFRGVRKLDLDGFVDFLIQTNMSNMQTRALSGVIDLLNILPPYAPLGPEALGTAKGKLSRNFECIGVVERFDESLLIMKRKLGWGRVYYRRLNVTEGRRQRTEVPPSTMARLVECNRYDTELYQEACRLLSAEIEAGGDDFAKELRRYQRNNAIYSRLLPIYEATGLYHVRHALRRTLGSMR